MCGYGCELAILMAERGVEGGSRDTPRLPREWTQALATEDSGVTAKAEGFLLGRFARHFGMIDLLAWPLRRLAR